MKQKNGGNTRKMILVVKTPKNYRKDNQTTTEVEKSLYHYCFPKITNFWSKRSNQLKLRHINYEHMKVNFQKVQKCATGRTYKP